MRRKYAPSVSTSTKASLGFTVACISLVLGCKEKPAPTPAPASAAAPAAAAPTAQQPADIAKFVALIAKHKAAPQKMSAEPDCETKGPNAGQCATSGDISEENAADVWYFKSAPTAVRFTAHFPINVTCDDLGAKHLLAWFPRPGIMGAGGQRCEFRSGELQGLQVVIERNKSPSGVPDTGVHVYSPEYPKRDKSFADAVATDEARAAER